MCFGEREVYFNSPAAAFEAVLGVGVDFEEVDSVSEGAAARVVVLRSFARGDSLDNCAAC